MSQHDYSIANQAGNLFRSDLNDALAAIVSQNAGAAAPTSTFAYQFWADTTNGWLKQRNGTNTAWVSLFRLATAAPIRMPVQSKASTYTVLETDVGSLLRATAAITFNLTAAATLGDGWWSDVRADGADVTIDPNGAETVDGVSTVTVQNGETRRLYCNGAGFYTSAFVGVPTGAVLDIAGSSTPSGLLLAYGQSLSTTTYAALFAQLGYAYGGSGANFNAPDCRGRSVFGKDNMGGTTIGRVTAGVSGVTGTTLGAVGGSEYMHTHTHGVTDQGHTHGGSYWQNFAGGGTPYNLNISLGVSTIPYAYTGISINNSGSGSSQNMPPAIIMNKAIKT